MKAFIIVIAVFFTGTAYGKVNCNKHKLYCTIVKLNPRINKTFAMKLSNIIYRAAKKHKVDPYRAIAIMRQESGININARNSSTDTISHKECDEWETCVIVKTITTKTTDFGLFQFHIDTMKRANLDIRQVMTDLDFTVNFAIKMIADKIKMCSRIWPETPWACYNSATEGKHQTYVKLVNQYYLGEQDDEAGQISKAQEQSTQYPPSNQGQFNQGH